MEGSLQKNQYSSLEKKIMLPKGRDEAILLDLSNLIYCESDGHYTFYHITNGKPHLGCKTLKVTEELLEKESFYRISRRFLINMNHVREYNHRDGIVLLTGNASCVVATRRRNEFLQLLKTIYYVLP